MKNYAIIIRMGAPAWDARVRLGDQWLTYDFRKMSKDERRNFTRQLTKAFRRERTK